MLGLPGPSLAQRHFWQLHYMYSVLGWQGTKPVSPGQFATQAAERSEQAAFEYSETMLDLERVALPRNIVDPYPLLELVNLDQEWGIYYLITRQCLAYGANDTKHLDPT